MGYFGLYWTLDYISGFLCCSYYSISSNQLGVVTAEHCRAEYPRLSNFILWILAEVSIVSCDIPEVIGTAFALNMLFNIPIWIGVLLTGLSTLGLLLLQRYGVGKLKFLITFLVITIATCFFVDIGYSQPVPSEISSNTKEKTITSFKVALDNEIE